MTSPYMIACVRNFRCCARRISGVLSSWNALLGCFDISKPSSFARYRLFSTHLSYTKLDFPTGDSTVGLAGCLLTFPSALRACL